MGIIIRFNRNQQKSNHQAVLIVLLLFSLSDYFEGPKHSDEAVEAQFWQPIFQKTAQILWGSSSQAQVWMEQTKTPSETLKTDYLLVIWHIAIRKIIFFFRVNHLLEWAFFFLHCFAMWNSWRVFLESSMIPVTKSISPHEVLAPWHVATLLRPPPWHLGTLRCWDPSTERCLPWGDRQRRS